MRVGCKWSHSAWIPLDLAVGVGLCLELKELVIPKEKVWSWILDTNMLVDYGLQKYARIIERMTVN